MQGFSSAIRDRYKQKWIKSLTGEGPRKKLEKHVSVPSEKLFEKRRKRRRVSVVEKY